MTTWLIEAHQHLTDRETPNLRLKYSGKYKGYNASVKYGADWMEFGLSKKWKEVDEDIQKGVVQHLLQKIYKIKGKTMYIEMYEEFLRQASKYQEKGESDPYLEERFHVINEEYFNGMMDQPTIKFGQFSTTRLGSYSYGDDTVTISTALQDDQDMLDYVLYHELLHKKHQFTCEGGRTTHHSKAFREDERKFKLPNAEKRLERYIAQKRREKRARKPKPKKQRSLFKFW